MQNENFLHVWKLLENYNSKYKLDKKNIININDKNRKYIDGVILEKFVIKLWVRLEPTTTGMIGQSTTNYATIVVPRPITPVVAGFSLTHRTEK